MKLLGLSWCYARWQTTTVGLLLQAARACNSRSRRIILKGCCLLGSLCSQQYVACCCMALPAHLRLLRHIGHHSGSLISAVLLGVVAICRIAPRGVGWGIRLPLLHSAAQDTSIGYPAACGTTQGSLLPCFLGMSWPSLVLVGVSCCMASQVLPQPLLPGDSCCPAMPCAGGLWLHGAWPRAPVLAAQAESILPVATMPQVTCQLPVQAACLAVSCSFLCYRGVV